MDKALTCAVFAASLLNIGTTNKSSFFTIDISDELVSQLSQLSLTELQAVIKRSSRFMTITIDSPVLTTVLQEVANDGENAELQDQFIYHRATAKMMREFFGMHTTDFCARRKRLGLAHLGQHRPPVCDEENEVLFWREYQRLKHLEIRHRYLKIAENTGQPLNVIWPAIQRHED